MIIGLWHPGSGSTSGDQMVYNKPMVFTKGQRGWNKGNRIKGQWLDCQRCGIRKWFTQYRLINGGGKFCSRACSNKSNARKGPECWNYKGSMTYGAIHDWLRDTFGSAKTCEKCGVCEQVQWSKLHGKEYERVRENFWQLCVACHIEYDKTSLVYRPVWNKGRSWTKEERKKISEGLKRYFSSL